MYYCHPKESAHAQDAREAKERALGVPNQALLKVGYHPHETTEIERMATALQDISAERQRQMSVEGWTAEHDDAHLDGALAQAAACYAGDQRVYNKTSPDGWPWSEAWWKPTNRRRDLVKAGALIIAEIERLDRMQDSTR